MIEAGQAYFIQHCDLPECDLGTFEYVCPKCEKYIIDYEIWWKEDNIWKGEEVNFQCPECGELLTVEWGKNNNQYNVKKCLFTLT